MTRAFSQMGALWGIDSGHNPENDGSSTRLHTCVSKRKSTMLNVQGLCTLLQSYVCIAKFQDDVFSPLEVLHVWAGIYTDTQPCIKFKLLMW